MKTNASKRSDDPSARPAQQPVRFHVVPIRKTAASAVCRDFGTGGLGT